MKHAFIAATICAATGIGAAQAADLPAKTAPVPPIVPVLPVFTWTGFYLGANAGYGFKVAASGYTDETYGTVAETGGKGGFLGGVQAGYNYQFTPGSGVVVGLEADFQGVSLGKSTATIGAVPYYSVAPSLDWFGTARGRIGYAFNRLMLYGTGGFAFGGGSASSYAASYPYTLPETTRTGFALGAGIEYALTDKIAAKLEALYVNLGKRGSGITYFDSAVPAYYGTGGGTEEFGLVRAGINYRF